MNELLEEVLRDRCDDGIKHFEILKSGSDLTCLQDIHQISLKIMYDNGYDHTEAMQFITYER